MKETRLLALMFTDIVGFSARMEMNEMQTIQLLQDHNQLVLPLIGSFQGKVVDSVGDGLLVRFDSLLACVNCALNIQNALAARNRTVEEHQRFQMRIGIHMGDVWCEGERIYGNGVNIAARLQQISRPGGICISEDVYHQIKNKDIIRFEEVNNPGLKNISRDFRVFYVLTGEGGAADSAEPGADPVEPSADAARDPASGSISSLSDRLERLITRTINPDTLQQRIENFVSSTLEKAVNNWENMPEDSREEIIEKLRRKDWFISIDDDEDSDRGGGKKTIAFSSSGKPGRFSIEIDAPGVKRSREHQIPEPGSSNAITAQDPARGGDGASVSRLEPGSSNAITARDPAPGGDGAGGSLDAKPPQPGGHVPGMIFGLVAGYGFWYGWMTGDSAWFPFLFFLLGALPFTISAANILGDLLRLGRYRRNQASRIERSTLNCARLHGGSLTVVQLADCSGLSFEEAQKELDRLASRGWVNQNIDDQGRIFYEFPSLIGDASDPVK